MKKCHKVVILCILSAAVVYLCLHRMILPTVTWMPKLSRSRPIKCINCPDMALTNPEDEGGAQHHQFNLPWRGQKPYCIEENICKDRYKNTPDIYYYHRTNFDELVEEEVDYNGVINHTYPVVPRIVHVILFSKGNYTFKFYQMLSMLSSYRYAKPDRIYFWHDTHLPVGKYWQETRRWIDNLFLIHRDKPIQIRGNNVSVIQHVSDIVRIEALLEYGGMYFDMDSIVVNSVDPLLVYDTTIGRKPNGLFTSYHLFSKPWSGFFKIWHRAYSTFEDRQYARHAMDVPSWLSKRYPNLIHVEHSLISNPDSAEGHRLFIPDELLDWGKNIAIHFYMAAIPSKYKPFTPENIKTLNTTGASIMRYVYYGKPDLIPH